MALMMYKAYRRFVMPVEQVSNISVTTDKPPLEQK